MSPLLTLHTAPPVYAPGGPVAFVAKEAQTALLPRLAQQAQEKGAVLLVVGCLVSDTARQEALEALRFTPASVWYKSSPDPAGTDSPSLRPARPDDVLALLALGEAHRDLKERLSPVFWKKAPVPAETFAPFVTSQVENENNTALVWDDAGFVRGYGILQDHGRYIDDCCVAAPSDWNTIGTALFAALRRHSYLRKASTLTVVVPFGDREKRAALEALDFPLAETWYVLPL